MIRFAHLESCGAAVAAFSGKAEGDCRPTDSAGRRTFCQACGVNPENVACMQQVHGVTVIEARAGQRGVLGEADALITNIPGLPLAVFTADCVPVYLLDPVRRAIALVHAGREGTFHRIAAHAVTALRDAYGCASADLYAVIGPSAGPARYEVSPELAAQWQDAGLPSHGRCLDLWGANRQQLIEAGLTDSAIETTNICTISDGRFHSHRAHPDGQRNMGLLALNSC